MHRNAASTPRSRRDHDAITTRSRRHHERITTKWAHGGPDAADRVAGQPAFLDARLLPCLGGLLQAARAV